ncbi:hypothetical protein [Alysiella crassa]|uniref:hypothetical protein n=1 Tax=Alysiella crassa TaxID=153491 RepID=UPI0011C0688F|nr:hypothetical protein [Alysiella crassa]
MNYIRLHGGLIVKDFCVNWQVDLSLVFVGVFVVSGCLQRENTVAIGLGTVFWRRLDWKPNMILGIEFVGRLGEPTYACLNLH